LAFFTVFALSGCGTLPDSRRIAEAAHSAFFNPNTLIPLAGAGVFAIDDFDEKVSQWATKHHPIFGSTENALDTNRRIKDILEAETYITALATDEPLKCLAVDYAALKITSSTTNFLKDETSRTRPNGSNDTSFPSACTSSAFAMATLSNRNLEHIESDWIKALQFGNLCLASTVAWSRVEAGAHYPSDVLAGAALGHFLSAFIQDAFLRPPKNEGISFSVIPSDGGAMAQLSFYF